MVDDFNYWGQITLRAFAMFGFTYFSVAATLGFSNWQPAVLAAGTYFFTELMRYYKMEPEKKGEMKMLI